MLCSERLKEVQEALLLLLSFCNVVVVVVVVGRVVCKDATNCEIEIKAGTRIARGHQYGVGLFRSKGVVDSNRRPVISKRKEEAARNVPITKIDARHMALLREDHRWLGSCGTPPMQQVPRLIRLNYRQKHASSIRGIA